MFSPVESYIMLVELLMTEDISGSVEVITLFEIKVIPTIVSAKKETNASSMALVRKCFAFNVITGIIFCQIILFYYK